MVPWTSSPIDGGGGRKRVWHRIGDTLELKKENCRWDSVPFSYIGDDKAVKVIAIFVCLAKVVLRLPWPPVRTIPPRLKLHPSLSCAKRRQINANWVRSWVGVPGKKKRT